MGEVAHPIPDPGEETRLAEARSSRLASSSWPAIAFVAALGLCLPAFHIVSELQPDSYMTLYAGRWIAQHGIPHSEVFTIVAHGRRWIDQQWVAELIDYEAWRIGGYAGLALLNASLIGFAYASVAALIRRRGGSVGLVIGCSVSALAAGLASLFIRAQDLALPLFVLLVALCLTDAERDLPGRRLLLLLPLLVLWANLHGSVLLGSGLAISYLAFRAWSMARRRFWRPGAACLALALLVAFTPLATPYGTQIFHYYGELLANKTISRAEAEWHSPVFGQFSFVIFAVPLALVLGSLVVSLIKRSKPPVVLLGLVTLTGVAAWLAARNIVWFSIAAALFVADTVRVWLTTQPPTREFLRTIAVAAGVTAVLGVALLATRSDSQYETLTPLRAVSAAAAYATSHPCARILGDNTAASALLWHYPSLAGRVAFDARLEQYPQRSLARWFTFQIARASDWPSAITGYQLLMGGSSVDPTLVSRLARLPNATVLAHDARGIAVLNHESSGPRCA